MKILKQMLTDIDNSEIKTNKRSFFVVQVKFDSNIDDNVAHLWVDNGLVVSLILDDKLIDLNNINLGSSTTLFGISGHPVSTLGKCDLRIAIGDEMYILHSFQVVSFNFPIIYH